MPPLICRSTCIQLHRLICKDKIILENIPGTKCFFFFPQISPAREIATVYFSDWRSECMHVEKTAMLELWCCRVYYFLAVSLCLYMSMEHRYTVYDPVFLSLSWMLTTFLSRTCTLALFLPFSFLPHGLGLTCNWGIFHQLPALVSDTGVYPTLATLLIWKVSCGNHKTHIIYIWLALKMFEY